MENNTSDNEWRHALEGAESAPAASVWSGIEMQLIAAENVKMKRRVIAYQRVAAGAILFALLIGALTFYRGGLINPANQEISASKKDTGLSDSTNRVRNDSLMRLTDNGQSRSSASVGEGANVEQSTDSQSRMSSIASRTSLTTALASSQSESHVDPKQTEDRVVEENETKDLLHSELFGKRDPLGFLATPAFRAGDLSLPKSSVDEDAAKPISPVLVKAEEQEILPRVQDDEPVRTGRITKEEQLWASVGAGAGVYSPGRTSPVQTFQSTLQNSTRGSKSSEMGSAYTMGVAIGGRVLPKWVLQGGVNYVNQSIGYSSSLALPAASPNTKTQPAVADYMSSTMAIGSTRNAYTLNSTLEFVTVPMQLGYLIVDRRLGVQLNAGVSSNFFLRNTLKDDEGQFDTFSQNAGQQSPYRSLSWSGLISTELSYRLASQYRFALVPGLRYGLNSSLKTGGDHPYIMDIGFRFRYIFQ